MIEAPPIHLDHQGTHTATLNSQPASAQNSEAGCTNRATGIMTHRIQSLQLSLGNVLTWVCIVLLHALVLIMVNARNNLGYATNFGYLAIGTMVLTVVLGTRNSIYQLLVGG